MTMPNRLTVLSWPDYISPATLAQFQAEFDIAVTVETAPSAVELVDRLRSSGPPPDVLCPPDYAVRELNSEHRLSPLDHDRLPNLKNLNPRFRAGRPHDPESRISVIKDWGTTGFMYREDRVSESPQSWGDFWALAPQYAGAITVLDSPGEVIGAALKMRGHSYNATDQAALGQARSDLLMLKPHLRAFETNYRPLLSSGEACLALGWNGDAAALRAAGVPIRYIIPSEGSQIWEDDWAIAAGAPQPEAAHLFLNFVLRPEVAAQEANYTGYATSNEAAYRLLGDQTRADSSIYPPQAVIQTLEPGLPLDPDAAAQRQRLWAEIRG
jgi:spermidine/putrescine transport system substrate-binding protein